MSRRSSPTHSQSGGSHKARESQPRFVQFSPSVPRSIPSTSSPHPPLPSVGGYPSDPRLDPYLDDDFVHGSAPADYHMEELSHDSFLASQGGQGGGQGQGGQVGGIGGGHEEEDPSLHLRRIQTSPSSLYSLGDHLLPAYSHPLLPTQPRTAINGPSSLPTLHQQQQHAVAVYSTQLQKKVIQQQHAEAHHSLSYEGGGGVYFSHSSNPSTPQSQPLQATVVPARALTSSGNSTASLTSLSPSSSSSSLSSMAGPSSRGAAPSPSHQSISQAAAAALMEQGMRRIKSSPIALSSLVIPAVNVPTSTSKRQKTATADNPTPTTSSRPSTQQKAQRRLQRKAEAARASRRRKKAYVVGLEDKVAKLNAKLELLRHDQLSGLKVEDRLSAVDAVHREEQQAIKQRMMHLLGELRQEQQGLMQAGMSTPMSAGESVASVTSPGSASDSATLTPSPSTRPPSSADAPSRHEELKQVVDSFITNSHKRQTSIDLYFHQLEKTLIPSVAVKFALWGLSQPDEFYQNDGLWQGVMGREVGLTSDQMGELLECKQDVTVAVNELHDVLQKMQGLRAEMKGHMEDRHKAIEDAVAVLTPQQLAAFCIWVEQNPMCMQMLETVWHTTSA